MTAAIEGFKPEGGVSIQDGIAPLPTHRMVATGTGLGRRQRGPVWAGWSKSDGSFDG